MDVQTNTNNLLSTAQEVLANSLNRASQSNLSTSIKDGLINSADSIQSLLNDVFKNNGLITEVQVNELDRQIELAKLKLLESESNKTSSNFAMYLGITVVVIGLLWYFTSQKEN
jgi:hypothetical protein